MKRLVLTVGARQVRVEGVRRGRVVASGEAGWNTPDELSERIGELAGLPEIRRIASVAGVRLHAPVVQLRRVADLPPVPGRALPGLAQHQSARLFRRNGQALVVDARWRGSRRRADRIVVTAAAAEPLIEAVLTGAREAGLRVLGIHPASAPWSGLDLLPRREQARRDSRSLRRAGVVSALGAALLVAATAAYGTRVHRADREARAELERLAPAAAALASLRQEATRARDMISAVRETEARRGEVMDVALEIAVALPDSAWLTGLVVGPRGKGRVSGIAARAVDVVARLERAAIPAPQLEGEAIPESIEGRRRERFTLRFGSNAP